MTDNPHRIVLAVLWLCLCGCASSGTRMDCPAASGGIPDDRIVIALDEKVAVPSGVAYERKDAEHNMRAALAVKNLLVSKRCPESGFSEIVTVGPFLWRTISAREEFASLSGPDLKFATLDAMGKLIVGEPENAAVLFDYVKRCLAAAGKITIRHLNGEELAIQGAFVMFDIEDPIFIIEGGGHKILIEQSEDLRVRWIEDLAGVEIKK